MSQNENTLKFSFSYNELVSLSFEKEAFLNRDLSDLTGRGITATRLTAFSNLRDAFVGILPDETMLAKITMAKEARDAAASPLRMAIREVQGIASNTFGSSSAQYKTLAPQTLSEMDAEGLYMLAPTIVSQGTAFMSQLSPKGLTAAMLTNITTLANALKPKIKEFTDAQGNQLLTTQSRHIAANALYDEMSDMCATAIVYYQDRNALKAGCYIMYDGGANTQQRNGIVEAGTTISRDFSAVTPESELKLKAFEGNDLVVYFSNSEAGVAATKSVTVTNNAVEYKTVTAGDLGYNPSAGYIHFCIKNNGTMDTGYRVVME